MFISSAAHSEVLVLIFSHGSRNLNIWEMRCLTEYPSGRRSIVESKHEQQQHTVRWYLFFSPFLLYYFSHFSKDRFNRATATLNHEHTWACRLYARKSSGSQEERGLHFGLTVVSSLKAFCLTGRPWIEQRYRYLGGCHGEDNDTLMIFFYGEGKKDLLHWWPWTTTSLMASKPRCPEVTASNTIWRGERRLITPVINGHMSSNGTWVRLHREVQLLLIRSALCRAAAGHTAAGRWRYFHNMSQSVGVMTCKCKIKFEPWDD